MVDVTVIEIGRNERPDPKEDWVLIQNMPNGRFRGFGHSSFLGGDASGFYTPTMFDTLDQAINHAREWAISAGVRSVYVRLLH